MNPAYSKYELIDKYLNKELSPAELDEFLHRMHHDEDLAETVELQQLAHEYILDKEMLELKEQMKADLGNNTSKRWIKNTLYSAGAIAIISAGIYSFWPSSDNSKPQSPIATAANPTIHVATGNLAINETAIKDPIIDNVNKSTNTIVKKSTAAVFTTSTENPTIESNKNPFYEADQSVVVSSNSEVKPSETNKETNAASPCEGIVLSALINTSTSCEGKSTGVIRIVSNSIKGGKEPYLVSFNDRSYKYENVFDGLPAGKYLIKIKDANNCLNTIEKEIDEVPCKKMIDDAFMPSMGEVWKYPVEDNQKATIQIFNEQGVSVFTNSLTGSNTEWEGKDNNGNSLPPGLYHFVLKYENGTTERGRITILR